MSDREAVVDRLARLFDRLDQHDRPGFADCWSQDAVLEIDMFDGQRLVFDGRDDLVGRMTAGWTAGQPSPMRHQLGAVAVEPTGPGSVRARFCCTYVTVGEEPALAGMGEYEDVLVREADGSWRIRRRRHQFLTPVKLSLK